MARCVLLLFLMSEWTYTLWSAPFLPPAPDDHLTAEQDVIPLAFHYKKQILEKVQLPSQHVASFEVVVPVECPHGRWSDLPEVNALALSGTDPLYVLMSLQR